MICSSICGANVHKLWPRYFSILARAAEEERVEMEKCAVAGHFKCYISNSSTYISKHTNCVCAVCHFLMVKGTAAVFPVKEKKKKFAQRWKKADGRGRSQGLLSDI